MAHASFIVGERVTRPGADINLESGYQVLRLSTELVPATLALLGAEQVSPFWAVLFYFILILFGIAQQVCACGVTSRPVKYKSLVEHVRAISHITASDMALRDNWYHGYQYKNDETLGNYHHLLQLRLCLHIRFTHGHGGK